MVRVSVGIARADGVRRGGFPAREPGDGADSCAAAASSSLEGGEEFGSRDCVFCFNRCGNFCFCLHGTFREFPRFRFFPIVEVRDAIEVPEEDLARFVAESEGWPGDAAAGGGSGSGEEGEAREEGV